MRWSDKDPQEIVTLGFDLADNLEDSEALMNVSTAVTVVSGTDPTPANVLFGSPEIDSTIVRQAVQGGMDSVRYRLSFTVDTLLGNRYVEAAVLDVRQRD